MTRKQALNKAIQILETLPKSQDYMDIICLLNDIHDELPLIHWSDKSIVDTVEQFIVDNDRNPTTSDFKKKGMPPHTVIKQKYKITLAEWLKQNYPTQKPSYNDLKVMYTKEFIEDYYKIKPKSQEEFNKNRSKGVKGWQTVAAYNNINSWRSLIKALDLPFFQNKSSYNQPIKVNIYHDMEENIKF